jgi:uncharacterized protein YjbI with pentapeptide repeats
MAEDKGTPTTPKQEKRPTRRVHIPRVVVVVLLASLLASAIAVLFAGEHLASLIASPIARSFLSSIYWRLGLFPGDIDNRAILWGIRTVAVLVGIGVSWRLIRIGYNYQWTGLGEAELPKQENVELRPRKTLWDWLQLLIVPLAVAGVGFWFTVQQDARQQTIQQQNAQDEALQNYLDEMGNLLLEKKLRKSEEDSEVRTLARARTLTVLGRLDSSRKAAVIQFLDEAQLIQRVERREPIIGLGGADLGGAGLSGANLSGAHLRTADLSGATLHRTDLSNARLSYADLSGARLLHTDLSNADLLWADLSNADVNSCDLSSADLKGAYMRDARLIFVHLNDARLSSATLVNTDLSLSDLTRAEGINNEELEQQAASLTGATMPNGQKYEEWLKSKGREEDGENTGPS